MGIGMPKWAPKWAKDGVKKLDNGRKTVQKNISKAATDGFDKVKKAKWQDIAHVGLGAASFVPGIGAVAAAADAGIYASQGKYADAALALAGAIPGGKVATTAVKGAKAASKAIGAAKAGKGAKAAKAEVTAARNGRDAATRGLNAANKGGGKANKAGVGAAQEKLNAAKGELKAARGGRHAANTKLKAANKELKAAKGELKSASKELLQAVKPSVNFRGLSAKSVARATGTVAKAGVVYGASEAAKKVVDQNGGPKWVQNANRFAMGKLASAALNIKGR